MGRKKLDPLEAVIKGYAAASELSAEELPGALGFSKSTWLRRLKNPGEFTREELERCQRRLCIPIEVMQQAVIRK